MKIQSQFTWQDKVPNNAVLERAEIPSMYTLLKQRRLRCLGHVVRMDDGRIPKDLFYGELAQGKRPTGRPQWCYKGVCKRDLKPLGIDINRWKTLVSNHSAWRQALQQGLIEFEETLAEQAETKRQARKAGNRKIGQQLTTSVLLTVWKGLSFLNWSFQPHKALFESFQSERDIIVFQD